MSAIDKPLDSEGRITIPRLLLVTSTIRYSKKIAHCLVQEEENLIKLKDFNQIIQDDIILGITSIDSKGRFYVKTLIPGIRTYRLYVKKHEIYVKFYG